ncbi:hypothetical protein V3481_001486 [Fusarium oxysporum f. sp. vasinfectum]
MHNTDLIAAMEYMGKKRNREYRDPCRSQITVKHGFDLPPPPPTFIQSPKLIPRFRVPCPCLLDRLLQFLAKVSLSLRLPSIISDIKMTTASCNHVPHLQPGLKLTPISSQGWIILHLLDI